MDFANKLQAAENGCVPCACVAKAFEDSLDLWYRDTARRCEERGLDHAVIFGNIHIYTKFGEWYFEPGMGKIRLMHRNTRQPNFDGFHTQFKKYITPRELVDYVYYHDRNKYGFPLHPAI